MTNKRTFDVVEEIVPEDDMEIAFVGHQAGWTELTVTEDCINTVNINGVILLCQAWAVVTGGNNIAQGDSGGPIFQYDGDPGVTDDVNLIGIYWGFWDEDPWRIVFSRYDYIYAELGFSSTWDSCATGLC